MRWNFQHLFSSLHHCFCSWFSFTIVWTLVFPFIFFLSHIDGYWNDFQISSPCVYHFKSYSCLLHHLHPSNLSVTSKQLHEGTADQSMFLMTKDKKVRLGQGGPNGHCNQISWCVVVDLQRSLGSEKDGRALMVECGPAGGHRVCH